MSSFSLSFSLVMSYIIFDTAMTFPLSSLIGDLFTATGKRDPSFLLWTRFCVIKQKRSRSGMKQGHPVCLLRFTKRCAVNLISIFAA